jgi:hypothetical protein
VSQPDARQRFAEQKSIGPAGRPIAPASRKQLMGQNFLAWKVSTAVRAPVLLNQGWLELQGKGRRGHRCVLLALSPWFGAILSPTSAAAKFDRALFDSFPKFQ